MQNLKKILLYAIPYKTYGILNIISNILYAFFGTLSFVSLMPMLKVLFDTAQKVTVKPEWTGVNNISSYFEDSLNYFITIKIDEIGVLKTLSIMIAVVISTFLLKNIFGYLAMYFITFMRNGIVKDLRNNLYKKIVSLPLSYYSEKRKGDVMARISTDVLEVQHSFLSVLELIVREPLMILFTISVMLGISPKLALFVFTFIPISGIIISFLGKKLRKQSNDVQKEQGYFLSLIEETLGGLRVIKGFNAEKYFNKRFNASTHRFFIFSNKLLNRQNLASPMSEFLGICSIAALLWFGGKLVLVDKTLTPDAFIVFMTLAYNVLTPAKAISKASYSIRKGNAAASRVLDVLHSSSSITDKPNATKKESFEEAICFNNVSFKYENEYVLKNISFTIPKGKTVAFVGQSGSGKSTIANLISRYYDVSKGSITIDGTDIRDLTTHSVRNLQGIVSQEALLFNDSVKNNILLGDAHTDDEIIKAAQIANASEYINELPKKFETVIGDGGNKLSGGQKQRLSIARAVLKNPPILILDEATSALDTESEKLVQDALEKMMENRTSIAIAHRLSTIQKADLIIVLHKGEIVEQGKHQELIAKKGIYKRLVEMQSI